jgi:small-conductance mechanosensitive channel
MLDEKAVLAVVRPVAIVVGLVLIGWVVELILISRLRHISRQMSWSGGEHIIRMFRFTIVLWSLLLGINLALPIVPFALSKEWRGAIYQGLLVAFIVSLTVLAARVLVGIIVNTARPDARPAVSLITNVVRIVVYLIGLLIILQIYKVDVSAELATLGVAGLAVSLALQATLTDLISGVQLIAVRQIRPGQYIKLSTGEEGYVVDIGWRTTQIRQLSNNIIIVPNAKMTSVVVTNFSEPDPSMALLVNIGVSYDSDLEKVERVTVDVAKQIMRTVAGSVADSEPFIRYSDLASYSIQFTVIMQVSAYVDQYLVKHEFVKLLHQRYQQEGIVIPFPTNTIHLSDDAASHDALEPRSQVEMSEPPRP